MMLEGACDEREQGDRNLALEGCGECNEHDTIPSQIFRDRREEGELENGCFRGDG